MKIEYKTNRQKLLIATNNSAKLAEMKQLLGELPYEIVSLADESIDFDVEETGTSFEENAVLKAKAYSAMSGILTLADDSGLEVKALNGEPGIHTNRYAGSNATGQEKVQFLLSKMVTVPEGERDARFTVSLALAWPDGRHQTVMGYYPGSLALAPRGAMIEKFPYRVIFIPKGWQLTLAQMNEQGIASESPRTTAIAEIKKIVSGFQGVALVE